VGAAESTRISPLRSLRRFLLPALLLTIYAAQCVWFIGTQSFTNDEPAHIAAGLAMWKYGRFSIVTDNPPLARKIAAAPLHFLTSVDIDNAHYYPGALPIGLRPEHAWYARLPFVGLGLAMGIAVWLAARWLFSESSANFVLALFAFSPGMIAHFSVAAADGAGTLTFFLAVAAFALWAESLSWKKALLLGLATGAMMIAKFSGAPIGAIILLLMCLEALRRRDAKILKQALTVAAIAYFLICFSYNFHIARFHFENGTMDAHFQHREQDWVARVPFHSSFTFYLPGGDYLDGLVTVYRNSRDGLMRSYLFGRAAATPSENFRGYHLFVMLLKWPPIVILSGLIGLALVLSRKVQLGRAFGAASLLPLAYLLFALSSRLQIGDRHVLPLYPFLLLAAGALWHFVRGSRGWIVALVAIAALNAIDAGRYAPDQLAYFTPFIRPTQTWRYLGDSNTDWGQGLISLKHYQEQHPQETIYLRTFGGFDPAFYGIRYRPFDENEKPHGTVVVSAVEMAGYNHADRQPMLWLWQHPLIAHLDHALFVFKVE
jgi:4-amino-4-deoxy-L-arabinose transferase-like glycosyltransferase